MWLVWNYHKWLELVSIFWPLIQSMQRYKRYISTTHHIIKCSNLEKFRYDDYLAISSSILLSYGVGVDMWLGEHYNFFRLSWIL